MRRAIGVALALLALAGCQSGGPPTPSVSPSAIKVDGYVTARWVGPYGEDDLDEAERDSCESELVPDGSVIKILPDQGQEVSAPLSDGEISDCRCSFHFEILVAQTHNYTVSLGSYVGEFDAADTTDLMFNLPAIFMPDEKRYLEAKKTPPESEDAGDTVAEGWSSCNGLKGSDHENRILSVLVSNFEKKAVKYLCPKYQRYVDEAKYAFEDGSYAVPKDVRPGTYRTFGPTSDCYWERSTDNGKSIANDFISNAQRGVRVTIFASDGGFKSEGCDLWVRD